MLRQPEAVDFSWHDDIGEEESDALALEQAERLGRILDGDHAIAEIGHLAHDARRTARVLDHQHRLPEARAGAGISGSRASASSRAKRGEEPERGSEPGSL